MLPDLLEGLPEGIRIAEASGSHETARIQAIRHALALPDTRGLAIGHTPDGAPRLDAAPPAALADPRIIPTLSIARADDRTFAAVDLQARRIGLDALDRRARTAPRQLRGAITLPRGAPAADRFCILVAESISKLLGLGLAQALASSLEIEISPAGTAGHYHVAFTTDVRARASLRLIVLPRVDLLLAIEISSPPLVP